MRAQAFLDGVIDTVKDESPLRRQTALGKSRRPRREQDRERIVFVDLNVRLLCAVPIEKTAVTQIRRKRDRLY